MKIAVFTDTFYPKVDGIVTSILNSSSQLLKRDTRVVVFCPKYESSKEVKIKGMSVYRFFSVSLASYKEVKIVLPNIARIISLLKKEEPDIIHIHTPGFLGYMGVLCSKIFKIPSVGTYHTLVSEQLMYISFKKLLKIERVVNKILESKFNKLIDRNRRKFTLFKRTKKEKLGKRIIWKLSCKIYNSCGRVIVPSKSIKKLLRHKGIKRKIDIVSNGINTRLFGSKKRYNKKVKRIIHVGRISFEKNVDVTIKAFARIAEKHKDIKYEIIGDGPALDSLRKLSQRLGLQDRIVFTGYINYKKLPVLYRRSDLFITASTMETQGLVILEAMSCGLPVIGVDAYAIPNLVKNGYNGFIAKPGSAVSMSNYMQVVVKNPRLCEVLGKNAALTAKEHDLEITSRSLEDIYKKMVSLYNF